jgi:hypothetical protein
MFLKGPSSKFYLKVHVDCEPGIDELHVVGLMTEQHSYNVQYFFSNIMESILNAIFPDGRKLLWPYSTVVKPSNTAKLNYTTF